MTGTIPFDIFEDIRGKLLYNNGFAMDEIKRMYIIQPADTSFIRGWQGHQEERKWFYCNKGQFKVYVVKVSDFGNPDGTIMPESFHLSFKDPKLLMIDKGYATAFKALEDGASLMVFSDMTTNQSKNDDFRFDLQTWNIK